MPNPHICAVLTVPKTHLEVLEATRILAERALHAAHLPRVHELEVNVVRTDLGKCILAIPELGFQEEGVNNFHKLTEHSKSQSGTALSASSED